MLHNICISDYDLTTVIEGIDFGLQMLLDTRLDQYVNVTYDSGFKVCFRRENSIESENCNPFR